MKNKAFFGVLIICMLFWAIPDTAMAVSIINQSDTDGPKAIHFSKLIEFFPEAPDGWSEEEPEGEMDVNDTISSASIRYMKDGSPSVEVEITVVDTASHEEVWLFFNNIGEEVSHEVPYRSSNKVEIKGFSAWEVYDEPEMSEYGIWIDIDERFLIVVRAFDCDKETRDYFLNSIDFKGISALNEGASMKDKGIVPGFEVILAIFGLFCIAYLMRSKN